MVERNAMSVYMICFCVLILIIYLLKADKRSHSSKRFIIAQVFVIICLCFNVYAVNAYKSFGETSPIPPLLARTYIFIYLCLFSAFETYIFEKIFKIRIRFNFNQKWNLPSKIIMFVIIVGTLGCYFLPNYFSFPENPDDYFFIFYGMASNFAYGICFGYQIFNIVYYLLTRKKKGILFREFIPMLVPPILFVIAIILNQFWSYSFFEMALTITITVIYFCYDKPDETVQVLLKQSIFDYEKASRFKTDFLSDVSHEIKTPLNSILNTLELSKSRDGVDAGLNKDIDDMIYSSLFLNETISNILLLSKAEHENFTFNRSIYDIRDEINSLSSIIKIRSRNKDVNLFVEIESDVPHLIKGERELILSIINNSLNYSNNYVKQGTVALKVGWLNNDDGTSSIIIQVNNICPDCGNLYSDINSGEVDIYESVNNADFGIDLSCLLTERLNGKIDFDYENNLHNTIIYTIPQEKSSVQFDFAEVNYEGKNILIVDDSAVNIKVATKTLEKIGFKVTSCSNGKDALDALEYNSFDVILLDINMPLMSGEETLKRMHNIPGFKSMVVALTADDGINSREKYISLGFSDYLVKPFRTNDLISVIESNKGGNL